MANKKKRKKPSKAQQKRKRSIAAKRGWETRRRKAKVIAKAKKKLSSKRGLAKRKKKLVEKLLSRLSAEDLRTLETVMKVTDDIKNWVSAVGPEMINRHGGISLYPSRARLLDTDDQNWIRRRMQEGEDYGYDLDSIAGELADEYELEVREIYTLFMS